MKWNEKCQVLYILSRKTSMKVENFLSFLRLFSHNFAILLAVTHQKDGDEIGRPSHTQKKRQLSSELDDEKKSYFRLICFHN